MFRGAFVLLWRILVVVAILLLTLLTTVFLFPFIDGYVPTFWAIIIFYGLVAYLAIPLIIRLYRFVRKPNHVPTHVDTRDGWASDPVNIALTVRDRVQLEKIMTDAGWLTADEHTFKNSWRELMALLTDRPYPSAPCSNLYMFGRRQDIAFQIPVGNSPRMRHHVRFWKVKVHIKANTSNQENFWFKTFASLTGRKRELWVGAATYDKRFLGIRWRNLQLTHHIEADTNIERDFLIDSLTLSGHVSKQSNLDASHPYEFRGQNFGVKIFSDGMIRLLKLRQFRLPTKRRKN